MFTKATGWWTTPIWIRNLLSQPCLPAKISKPCAVSTVPSVMGSTTRVVRSFLPRKRWRSLKATGIAASTLIAATGRANRIVNQTESKVNESLKKAT